tara:strand:+ start:764 stop:970 length:207 start_codon:yes stop_codon:yes gene_type:complete
MGPISNESWKYPDDTELEPALKITGYAARVLRLAQHENVNVVLLPWPDGVRLRLALPPLLNLRLFSIT